MLVELTSLLQRADRKRATRPGPIWPSLGVCVAVAAAALGAAAAGGLRGSVLLEAPASFALLGVFLALDRWAEAGRLRADADEWIARGYESPASRYGWRVVELTSERERKLLARSVRDIVLELDAARRSPFVPIDRAALRPHRDLITSIADRLSRLDRPVAAGGVLAVHRFLTQPDSCLYAPLAYGGRIPRAEVELTEALDRLEVRR